MVTELVVVVECGGFGGLWWIWCGGGWCWIVDGGCQDGDDIQGRTDRNGWMDGWMDVDVDKREIEREREEEKKK